MTLAPLIVDSSRDRWAPHGATPCVVSQGGVRVTWSDHKGTLASAPPLGGCGGLLGPLGAWCDMPLVWPSHAPRRSAMLCWAPRGSGPMDRVSAYPRYPCGPSPPPPERAVSMTAASCGDDANLRPCGARCIRKVSGDAQRHCQCCLVGSNERRHPVVPPGSMPGAGCHCACRLRVCLCCAPLSHMGTRGARFAPQSAQGRGDPSALGRVPSRLGAI